MSPELPPIEGIPDGVPIAAIRAAFESLGIRDFDNLARVEFTPTQVEVQWYLGKARIKHTVQLPILRPGADS